MYPLDSTIVLILRKSVHTPDNSSVNPKKKQAAPRAYMALNRDYMCAQKRAKFVLAEPKPDVKDMYVKDFQRQLLADAEAFIEFIQFILCADGTSYPTHQYNYCMFSILPGCMKIQYTVKPLYNTLITSYPL